MSHVDDGTLHAYLDGELSPVEVERLETHVAACRGCRDRLDEERALIDRAARLLGMAVPPGPERAAPPLHELRRPPPPRPWTWSRLRMPLAWAATIVAAVGIGYFAGVSSFSIPQRSLARTESQPTADVAASSAPAAGAADTRSPVLPATPTDDELTATQPLGYAQASDRLARAETDQQRQAPAANAAEPGRERDQRADASLRPSAAPPAALPQDRASPTLREAAPAAAPSSAASGVISMAQSTTAVRGFRDANSVRLSTTWPAIAAKPARDLLGAAPAVIPGFAVRSMRRNPGVKEVVVEQEIAGAVVSLFQRPLGDTRAPEEAQPIVIDGAVSRDSLVAKARRNERLARFVGSLRVEIAGPLPADSLSRLLDLVRP